MGVSNRIAAARQLRLSAAVHSALKAGEPVVALESALITHGLPYPQNLEIARELEAEVSRGGALPATIAVIRGEITVGTGDPELRALAENADSQKIGLRDLAAATIQGLSGGTTVASSIYAATKAGIQVFATGGIGGVHRGSPIDVSADLTALEQYPVIVVSAGAKAILDLPATSERLETLRVPVVGYRTDDFPAFYSRESGLDVSVRLNSADEIAEYWEAHLALEMPTAILVVNPIPPEHAIPRDEVEALIARASEEARQQGIHGKAVTPYLLARLAALTAGKSVAANRALLLNNARLGAEIAAAVARRTHERDAER